MRDNTVNRTTEWVMTNDYMVNNEYYERISSGDVCWLWRYWLFDADAKTADVITRVDLHDNRENGYDENQGKVIVIYIYLQSTIRFNPLVDSYNITFYYYFIITNIKIFIIQLFIGIQHINDYYEFNRSRKIMICVL